MDSLGVVEGAVISTIGVSITLAAPRIASIPHTRWYQQMQRYYPMRRIMPAAFTAFFEADEYRKRWVIFWRVVGLSWLISGIELIVGICPAVRLR